MRNALEFKKYSTYSRQTLRLFFSLTNKPEIESIINF